MRAAVDRDELLARWDRVCRAWGTPALRREIFGQLFSAYTGPDRHYHDIRHVADCLHELDSIRALAQRPEAIELAIWFHDVIYDGLRVDNEERSADAARAALSRLGADAALIEQVVQLIHFTRHDRDPETADGRLMVDIDLVSLALPPEAFDENSRRIRREFSHVSDADFVRGRRQMLERFLDRATVFYTAVFRDRYEQAARANLSRVVTGSPAE